LDCSWYRTSELDWPRPGRRWPPPVEGERSHQRDADGRVTEADSQFLDGNQDDCYEKKRPATARAADTAVRDSANAYIRALHSLWLDAVIGRATCRLVEPGGTDLGSLRYLGFSACLQWMHAGHLLALKPSKTWLPPRGGCFSGVSSQPCRIGSSLTSHECFSSRVVSPSPSIMTFGRFDALLEPFFGASALPRI
jgi:hypothetical protein